MGRLKVRLGDIVQLNAMHENYWHEDPIEAADFLVNVAHGQGRFWITRLDVFGRLTAQGLSARSCELVVVGHLESFPPYEAQVGDVVACFGRSIECLNGPSKIVRCGDTTHVKDTLGDERFIPSTQLLLIYRPAQGLRRKKLGPQLSYSRRGKFKTKPVKKATPKKVGKPRKAKKPEKFGEPVEVTSVTPADTFSAMLDDFVIGFVPSAAFNDAVLHNDSYRRLVPFLMWEYLDLFGARCVAHELRRQLAASGGDEINILTTQTLETPHIFVIKATARFDKVEMSMTYTLDANVWRRREPRK